MYLTAVILLCATCAFADVSHILPEQQTTTTLPPPPSPYIFSYTAGRAPGHVDRSHTEVSDGTGIVRGAFSYVDPTQQLRTVKYVADQHGFHPQLSHEPEDTEANKLARAKHIELYHKIAEQHANGDAFFEPTGPVNSEAVLRATQNHLNLFEKIAQQHALIGAQQEAERQAFEATSEANQLGELQYPH